MKLRGKAKDILRFFHEGLDASQWLGGEKIEDQVFDESGEEEIYFEFKNEPHIKETRRAFITGDSVYCYYDNEDEDIVACANVKQAWAFVAGDGNDLKKWQEISNEYNVDIRLFGIESGMEFTQEVIIVRGRKPIVNEKQYEDWMWECPFPNMGG
jgi:hypothetical protein